MTPTAEAMASVLKVTGKQLYRYNLDARVDKFTELLPHYMHVRFTNNMLISPESTPQDDLFQRNDSYFSNAMTATSSISNQTMSTTRRSRKMSGSPVRRRSGSGCLRIERRRGRW